MTADKPDEDRFELFWRSHAMCRQLADAALELARYFPFRGPPLSDIRLERFRAELQRIHQETFHPDSTRPVRPSLRIVSSQGD